ncbi:hypothetical protein F5Y04DRAFT_259167 [Hypomontagnella monticulosa]|nr:hypothetical protein F5Y04DRAFT_259167 [Hypomontagnella monticulosa]
MLEKTAASLEPCGFHRAVPGAAQSFRTTRQLRTAFWRHGATDLELSTAWQALMHGTFDLNMATSEENKSPALSASAFLLDFLYPSGAVTLMRRLAPTPRTFRTSDKFYHEQRFTKLASRLYTSSLPKQQAHRPESEIPPNQETHETNENVVAEINESSDREVVQMDRHADTDVYETPSGIETPVGDMGDSRVDVDHLEALENFLIDGDPEDADRVWYHYKALDEPLQTDYIDRVLTFLSKSGRISDSWKISELFHKLPLSLWTGRFFVAGVTAELNLQNEDRALEIFTKGLEIENSVASLPYFVDALDALLASALRSPTTEFLKDIWKHYPKMAARWTFAIAAKQVQKGASAFDSAVLKDVLRYYTRLCSKRKMEAIISQLTRVASVPGLAEKALEFRTLRKLHGFSSFDREALDTLQRILVRRALVSCADDQVIPLLSITKDFFAFEEFLRSVTSRGKGELGVEVYNIYRSIPGSIPTHAVLYEMFKAYDSLNAPISVKYAGLESLWSDWYRFHRFPSRRAFQKFLAFHASCGHTERVYDIWIKYVDGFRNNLTFLILEGDDTFTHLLQVHAVQGQVEETQRIFDDISKRFRMNPNTHCWNILLNAYVKAGDYDGAISTFEKHVAMGRPDAYSYGTMIQLAGDRGDLGFTVDLYHRSRAAGVRADEAILCGLVDAYCRNDYLQAAEDVIVRAAKEKVASTYIFNKLINHYGARRDLAGINKVLEIMAEKNVPFDKYTYRQLLIGLSVCRQSQHALNLLITALKDNIFEVTTEHFSTVMGSLITSGEPGAALRLHKLMQDYGFPSSSDTLFRLTQALGKYEHMPPKIRSSKPASEWLGEILRSFHNIYGLGRKEESESESLEISSSDHSPEQHGRLLKKTTERFHFSTMVRMLTDLRYFTGARELVDLFRYIFKDEEGSDDILPVAMLNSMMIADFKEAQDDRVTEAWEILFETAKREGRSADFEEGVADAPKISPKYRYILSDGLKIMQKLLLSRQDATGLKNLIQEIRSEGFEVDSMNWNFYIQALIELNQYKEAFVTCEQILMPNWRGWGHLRRRERVPGTDPNIPLDERRRGTTYAHHRPIATTLYYLARGYMELEQLTHWSTEAAVTFQKIEEECMQVVRAIKSMERNYSSFEEAILHKDDFVAKVNRDDIEYYDEDDDSF